MKVSPQVKCTVCGSVFCCAKCRLRHEQVKHSKEIELNNKAAEIFCAICNNQPFILTPHLSNELLLHISKHFPLRCRKCSMIFKTKTHLLEKSKCDLTNLSCRLESAITISVSSSPNQDNHVHSSSSMNGHKMIATATQTSPHPGTSGNQNNTPPTFSNLQWKQKMISDGNLSESPTSFNVSAQTQTDLKPISSVRTTSTPMQALLLKVKDSSSCHVSSIYASTSSESDVSPPTKNNTTSFSPNTAKLDAKPRKTRGRGKLPVSATPLRQVMSKSIQRALAEHGGINYRDKIVQPKKIFDSMNNSYCLASPLDLRTSPALRRTQSEIVDRSSTYEEFQSRTCSRKQIFSSTKHIITENISPYEKLETVYETCRSIESSTISHIISENIPKSADIRTNQSHITPRIASGGILKKSISYCTPEVSPKKQDVDETDDVFYTPSARPQNSFSSSMLPIPRVIRSSSTDEENERTDSKPIKTTTGKLWSLVTSVMRLTSFGRDKLKKEESIMKSESQVLVKRCASFPGSTATSTDDSVPQHVKRKRTCTFDNAVVCSDPDVANCRPGPTKRIKRIQGRKPIDRMRHLT